jgi:hypothetical protein
MSTATIIQNLRLEKDQYEARRRKLLERLSVEINSLPDNPRIKRLTANCFAIHWKDLNNNWSVEHHDFEWCYREIAKRISKSEDGEKTLKDIIEEGKLVMRSYRPVNTSWTVTLHSDVLETLRKL